MARGLLVVLLFAATTTIAQERTVITRTNAPVTIDGKLTDAAWQSATKYETWYETNPGDNIPARFKSTGYVTYDDRFFYVGIDMEDPNPKQISGVYGDHDAISGQNDDFAGVIIDTRNDGKTALEFFVTSRNVQYDAVQDDGGSGEDSSPDFFWDSEVSIHERGWTMEMRIPFSSLRYTDANPEQWGLILYRNMPRDRRIQMFTNKLPRDSSCFICNIGKITGLTNLPTGDHMVIAPYATTNRLEERRQGLLVTDPIGYDAGLDFKWNPTADTTIDATINPDFSQIESDVAVISTNERFAINIAEKRPFFLEGVELFSTPIQAVYTRTITAPRWGTRATGREGKYSYTLLLAQDEGGGLVIIPGAEFSDAGLQDFSSTTLIGRVRRDVGKNSFIGLLTTAKQASGEDAHNRVFGPDFQFRLGDHHTFTGQVLYSNTQTPNLPDFGSEWDGRKLSGHGAYGWYQYATEKLDYFVNYSDYDDEFRADNGFVPQVGYRGSYTEAGRTWRPKGFFNRVRYFAMGEYQQKQDGQTLYRMVSTGFGADGLKRSFWRFRFAHDTVRNTVGNDTRLFDRNRLYYTVQLSPNKAFTFVGLDGWIGDDVDFGSNRAGKGASIGLNGTIRPNEHLQINLTNAVRWLSLGGDRLFTSQLERIRATYTFNSRMFVRAIVQNTRTNFDVELNDDRGVRLSGGLGTQLLFAYKLNWQTVFFVGAGDLESVTPDDGDFLRANRQFFAKVSYAFQR